MPEFEFELEEFHRRSSSHQQVCSLILNFAHLYYLRYSDHRQVYMHSIRPNKPTGQSYWMSTGGKRRRCSSPPPYTESIPSTTMRTPDIFETDTPVPEDVSRNSAPTSSLSTVATVADVISAPNPLIRGHSTFLAASNENPSHATVASSDDRVCLTCVRLWADRWQSNPPHQACRFPNGAVLGACIPCNQRRRRCFPVSRPQLIHPYTGYFVNTS
jgi:hypothetical protein